jgi:hypothetical protein
MERKEKIEKSTTSEAVSEAEQIKQRKIELLRREVSDSVGQVLAAEKSREAEENEKSGPQDIAPLIDAAGRFAEENRFITPRGEKEEKLGDFDKRRFSWGLIGDAVKETAFVSIYKEVAPHMRSDYSAAEDFINDKIREIIRRLSPSIYRNSDELRVALIALKEKFYESYPEVRALIYGAAEGKRAKIKAPKGETAEEYAKKHGISEEREENSGHQEEEPEYEHPRYLKEKTWEVPRASELKPGLIIKLENVKTGEKEVVELLGEPEKLSGTGDELYVKAEGIGGTHANVSAIYRSLAQMGLAAYSDGEWDGWWRPTHWDMKLEENPASENPDHSAAVGKESRTPISPDELKPGLMIEIEDVKTGKRKTVEILSNVYKDKKGKAVCYTKSVREGTGLLTYEALILEEIGITPYKDGAQKAQWRPIRKYMNTEGENK